MRVIDDYEAADVVELGRAQDTVLGEKIVDSMDSQTLEFGTRFIVATQD